MKKKHGSYGIGLVLLLVQINTEIYKSNSNVFYYLIGDGLFLTLAILFIGIAFLEDYIHKKKVKN